MGYTTNGAITNFWPDDTDTEMYIATALCGGLSFEELQERVATKWPDAKLADITIEAKYIHTNCIYYDRYDPGDYTNFIVVERMK